MVEVREIQSQFQSINDTNPTFPLPRKHDWLRQFFRFGLVGGVNTVLDLAILNGLFVVFPTNRTWLVLIYNGIAYSLGAVNSFLCNKYWTFKSGTRTTWGELVRFAITTVGGMTSNTVLVGLMSLVPHAAIGNVVLWTNVSKVFAICVSAFVSYLGMHLWVFMKKSNGGIKRDE